MIPIYYLLSLDSCFKNEKHWLQNSSFPKTCSKEVVSLVYCYFRPLELAITRLWALGLVHMHACSVVSNSLWPHGQWPTRLLCPWNFPGKNTGMSCYFLLQGIYLTQGLNLCLLHFLCWWWVLYHCSTWEAIQNYVFFNKHTDFVICLNTSCIERRQDMFSHKIGLVHTYPLLLYIWLKT